MFGAGIKVVGDGFIVTDVGLTGTALPAAGTPLLAAMDCQKLQSVSVQVRGTWVGTILFEVSNDGNLWVSKSLVSSASGGLASTTTSNNIFFGDIGARYFRARFSAYTSGTAEVVANINALSYNPPIAPATTVTTSSANADTTASTTNLAAGATYTQGTQDGGSTIGTRPTRIRPVVMHTAGLVPGHLVLQESTDGTAWRETRRTPIPSDSSYRSFDWPLHMRYYRLLFINGTTAQTGFFLQYSAVHGEGSSLDVENNLSFLLSQAVLTAAATFTSSVLDLGDNSNWGTIKARVRLATASATVTVRIESSVDGVNNWAASPDSIVTTTAAGVVVVARGIIERYQRVVVVNGATAQASNDISLALQTI